MIRRHPARHTQERLGPARIDIDPLSAKTGDCPPQRLAARLVARRRAEGCKLARRQHVVTSRALIMLPARSAPVLRLATPPS